MNALTEFIKSSAEYKSLSGDIKRGRLPIGALGLMPAPKAHLIATLCSEHKKAALVLVPDEPTAHKLAGDLCVMGLRASVYPTKDLSLRSAQSRSKDFEHKRIAVLTDILSGSADAVIATAEAASQFTIPSATLRELTASISIGSEIGLNEIKKRLLAAGYVYNDTVDGFGQYATRGGIIDFFPPDSAQPVRIELWGDTVDSMGHFDIVSQRRTDAIAAIQITPSSEIVFNSNEEFIEKLSSFCQGVKGKGSVKARQGINADIENLAAGLSVSAIDKYIGLAYEEPETLFDYCLDMLFFVCESASVKERSLSAERLLHEDIKLLFEDGILCKGLDSFCLPFSSVIGLYERLGAIYLDNFARGSFDTPVKDLVTFNVRQLSAWDGSLSVLLDDLKPLINRDYSIVVFAGSTKAAEGLCMDLLDEGIHSAYYPKLPSQFGKKTVNVLSGSLSAGIEYPMEKVAFFSYGKGRGSFVTKRPTAHKAPGKMNAFHSIDELHRGDYVVHSIHGIGVFDGINKMEVGGIVKDYIKIKYAGADVLYVPVTQLDLVSKYIGPGNDDGKTLKLNRLGSKDWQKTKTKVKAAVKEMAGELLSIYSKRLNTPGYAFSPDIDMQSDFERRFEFDETNDQLRCIYEIKQDMEKPYPMDRLLCGDVGFGKTEVALRAAFKCIADGKQCAFLVPTTILALQHYQTIMKRFEGFPINAEMLSRFRTPKQQSQIIKELRRGNIDIIVGTHRLISKDIEFKDLGLLIIDEEQRFGVSQKEKLKAVFPNVDVLTLSATPIPRTLNMAMTGIRDMSVIEESPSDRLPIQSYVLEHDMGVLAEAMTKELRRGGQVYYLHNKVGDIRDVAARVQKSLPDARIGIAHGQMSEEEISLVWRQLLEGEIDILVCTTIIETGIDVPNVNTLIIENADRMGLAQLHQIRGRVGRSSRRASAYFTIERGKQVNEVASMRLDAIREYTEFGSGFKIAMRDLEIRGAGNVLGAQQHGHMEAVGYDLYIKLLAEAVANAESASKEGNEESLRQKEALKEKECLIDIRMTAHIPEKYIESVPQRLGIYRRIADIKTSEDADDVMDELIDRFGEPPVGVKGLITISLLRNRAANYGVYEIKQRGDNFIFMMKDIKMEQVQKLALALRSRIMVNAGETPYITVKPKPSQAPLACLSEVFDALDRDLPAEK